MFKLKIVSSITLLSLTMLLLQPPLALASTKQSDITQPLDNYSQLIEQQYNIKSEKRKKDSKPHSEDLIARNQTDYIINAFKTSGLTPDKATVSTSVKSISPRANRYIILVYMTTNVIYHRLNENNRKVNNSCQWTDLHKLTLSTQDNSNKVVTEDKLLPERSDDNNNSDTNGGKTITNAKDGISTQQALTLRHTPITARAGKKPILPNFMNGIRYALKWTDYPYNGDEKSDYNPSYPYNETDNCANFVSQSIHEGGAPYQTALSTNTKDPNLWTPNLILGHDT
ncbi:amidase domain-containing protein [Bifidobacterium sp. MA2]|uniref:Amidase domain-containing protein n=1 Tax=Bifidobacterium santillanense TaxID=2809028 RepID=A0ABS5URB1_9BIFI|nr:amidase domain-containing protein [Bifidobacterium santillanense]MBT1173497.1 amidase domain-containing protein [Bifidobacterium santillanense]